MNQPYRESGWRPIEDPVEQARADVLRAVAEGIRALNAEMANGYRNADEYVASVEALRDLYEAVMRPASPT